MISVLNHQMNIERQIRVTTNRPNNRGAKRNVIHEVSIHDVAMNPIGPGFLDGANFIAETREVGREDRRCNNDAGHRQQVGMRNGQRPIGIFPIRIRFGARFACSLTVPFTKVCVLRA
jgi:hypothetical protein